MNDAGSTADPRVPPGIWLGFAAMCVGMFMAILDIQVVATSLPTIAGALDIAPDRVSWIQTAYLVAEIVAIPLTGWLTRLLGLRLLFAVAVGLFTLASAACAAAGGFDGLIAGRIVQGFAGGALIPTVFSAVFMLFPEPVQGRATTLAGLLAVLAPTLGPVVGGWLTATWSWHWLFLINILPGIAALLGGLAFLPRRRPDATALGEADPLALALLACGLAALEIGLKQAPDRGWASPVVVGLVAVFAVAAVLLVRRSRRRRPPLVDFDDFRDRNFAVGCALSFLLGAGLYGSVYLMPVFLGFVRGLDALAIGTIMLATGLAQLVAAPVAVWLEQRVDAKMLTAAGFTVFAAGLALSIGDTPATGWRDMLLPQILRGAAIMFCLLPPTRLALGRLSPARVPNGSGVFNLMRNLGGAIGIALIDTILYGRAPGHVAELGRRLLAGDLAAARYVGLPDAAVAALPAAAADPAMAANLRVLVERAGFATAVGEAWMLLAVLAVAAVAVLPVVGAGSRRSAGSP